DAVYKFKRYEDASLEYTGIDKHTGSVIGLWDTAVDTSVISGSTRQSEAGSTSVFAGSDRQSRVPEPEPWGHLQVGGTVIHKSFGPGEILSIDEKYLIVRFYDRESKFLYPGAFDKGYLLTPQE
ncbi:MAG: hypothetical protein IJ636_01180, partial [Bacteroidales bacterium]|nr:hypothetical protein [Bacteroidales bacterium]